MESAYFCVRSFYVFKIKLKKKKNLNALVWMHTCQCEGLRPDTRQLLPQVLGAPAELGGPSSELLLPGAWAETARTGPPAATAPVGNEPSKQSGNKKIRLQTSTILKGIKKKREKKLPHRYSEQQQQTE